MHSKLRDLQFFLPAALLWAAAPCRLLGQSTPVSQSRGMWATTYANGFFCNNPDYQSGASAAPDLGPWTDLLHVHSSFCFGGMDAEFSQSSTLGAALIHAEGQARVYHAQNGSGSDTSAAGSCSFGYTFSVDRVTEYTLVGTLRADQCFWDMDQLPAAAAVSLHDVFLFTNDQYHPNNHAFSTSGTLQPGTYTISADARESWGGLSNDHSPISVDARFSFDLTLIGPCLADFNHDGVLNSRDFFEFLTAFFASDPEADFNQDGAVNSQDLFDFLGEFFGGCD